MLLFIDLLIQLLRSFHSPLDQKLENRIDFLLANQLVQTCPLMSDECFSSNEFAGTAD